MADNPQKVIEICELCKGTGLKHCEHNKNVLARQSKRYLVCPNCNGEGVPPINRMKCDDARAI
jgi:DnaJ-class molecular chaperone